MDSASVVKGVICKEVFSVIRYDDAEFGIVTICGYAIFCVSFDRWGVIVSTKVLLQPILWNDLSAYKDSHILDYVCLESTENPVVSL